jgi:methylated-DNA-protein-cysteine methyltransferase-like protein
MPRSDAFIRIKAQVLEVVAAIPEARLSTYQAIGEHLDVMPRHVAYILSQLDPASKQVYPWYRVVAADGSLGVPKRGPDGQTQAERLASEGIAVTANSVATQLAARLVPVDALDHGIAKQTRPPPSADAGRTAATGSARRRRPPR